jgi:hypothetical protein
VQVGWLRAHLRDRVDSRVLDGNLKLERPIHVNGKDKDTIIVGQGKPVLDSIRDAGRLEKFINQFSDIVQWFVRNPDASPEQYEVSA